MPLRLRPFLFTLVLIATACGLRWPGLAKTVWNLDEGSTFTMAQIVRNGGVMYHDAADNRTPLVPYVKALILSVVGDWNIRGAHIVMAILLGLTAVWLWRLAREGKDAAVGCVSAVYFTFLSFIMLETVDTMAAHTGWFLIFFSALGMWAFVAALNRESGKLAALAGGIFALAGLAKQPGVLDWGVCLVVCALVAWTVPSRRASCARLAVMLALGFAAPLIATFVYFKAHGAWSDLVQYAWSYNTQLYIPEVPFGERLLGIRTPFQLAYENAPYSLGLGLLGAISLLAAALPSLWKRPKEFPVLPWLILGWSASGLLATILSGRTFAHYSIQVLPGLSLACGWVTVRIWEKTANWRKGAGQFGGWVLRTALGIGFLSLAWIAVHRAATLDVTESISKDIGQVIKARTRPDERIFVWGYEPELHIFSERLPNTRFVYSVFLTGLIPWTNLDPQKNTDYAIVPGAWDAFWREFTAQPPAMIVDTRSNRGFLKYPLRRQSRLWKIIQSEYVEVEEDFANARGYSLYQRAVTAPADNLETISVNDQLALAAPGHCAPGSQKVRVKVPADTTAVDLYLDGHPYRRLANPTRQSVQACFLILESDLPIGPHSVQVVARGEKDFASSPNTVTVESTSADEQRFAGPWLTFGGHEFTPIESESVLGQPIGLQKEGGQWDAHAPSRLVYLRPAGLTKVDFTLGILPGAYDGTNPQRTDGVDVIALFEDDDGRQTQVYRRNIDPVTNVADRVLIAGHVSLPGTTGGKIIFLITPGPRNNPAYDWAYWRNLTGDTPSIELSFRGQPIPPIPQKEKLSVSVMDFRNRRVQLVPAPSHFAFRPLAGMTGFSGEFGLLDESWQGLQQSSGAVFSIEQSLPDGKRRTLFTRTLYPANKDDDRGVQSFQLSLSYVEGAEIHLTTRAVNPANNALNYTFWHGLTLGEFPAHLAFEGNEINSIHSEAVNGFSYMDEAGTNVLFAHAPSELVFPLDHAARRLEGEIGLLQRAYTGEGLTDGVVFVVETETKSGGRQELFRRHLNPRDVPADRGFIPFVVELPAIPEGRLILRTLAAPSGKLNCAWSYWSKLQLSR